MGEGVVTEQFPVTAKLDSAKPILRSLPGWKCDISEVRVFEDLPEATKEYVAFVESAIGVKIGSVSVGPRREQTIQR